MAAPQSFLREDFEREPEVILEELRRGQDSPDRQLYEELFGLTYRKHPYGRPVIGFEKTLKAAKVSDLERYYRRNYVSSRMGLVLVGPIEDPKGARKKKLLALLEKRFGKRVIPERKAPARDLPVEKSVQSLRMKTKKFDIQTPELALSFRIPELTHPDAPLLEVLAGVLGSGESSRLYRSLFYDRSLVTDVSASVYIPKDPGMFLISAELKETGDLETVCAGIVSEIRKLIESGVSKDEIDRVVTNIESEKLYATQTVDGMASRVGLLRFSLGDLKFDAEYLEQIKSVSSSTLVRLAREYLTPERMSLVLLQPESEKPRELQTLKSCFAPLGGPASRGKMKKSSGAPGAPRIITTPSGLRVAYTERPGSPVFSIYASAFGGSRSELGLGEENWGVSHLISQIWAKGTPDLDSKTLSAIIEGCAASLDGFSGEYDRAPIHGPGARLGPPVRYFFRSVLPPRLRRGGAGPRQAHHPRHDPLHSEPLFASVFPLVHGEPVRRAPLRPLSARHRGTSGTDPRRGSAPAPLRFRSPEEPRSFGGRRHPV